jgi:hypothetical protein
LTISNPDSGSYKLNILIPTITPASYWQSVAISANTNANGFYKGISGYYSKYFNSNIDVTLQMFDAANTLTTNATLATTYTYTVKLSKMINGVSFNGATVSKVSTSSAFSLVPPIRNI